MGESNIPALSLKENFKKQKIYRNGKTVRLWEEESSPRAGKLGCRRAGKMSRTFKSRKQGAGVDSSMNRDENCGYADCILQAGQEPSQLKYLWRESRR